MSSALIALTIPKCTQEFTCVSLSVRLESPAVRLHEGLGSRRTSASPIINRVGTESTVLLLSFDQSARGLLANHPLPARSDSLA